MAKYRLSYTVSDVIAPSYYRLGRERQSFHTVRYSARPKVRYVAPVIKQRYVAPLAVQDTEAPLYNMPTGGSGITPSSTNVKYRDVAAAGRIVFMLILMLAYFNVVFGNGVEKSPFYIGLDIAQSIAERGASVKTGFMTDFKTFMHDLNNLRRFNISNWGEDVSFLEFLDMCWSGLKAPFTFINFLISLMENMLEIVLGAFEILFGLI